MTHLSFKSFNAVTADAFISLFSFFFLLYLLYLLFTAEMSTTAQLMPFFIGSLSKGGSGDEAACRSPWRPWSWPDACSLACSQNTMP